MSAIHTTHRTPTLDGPRYSASDRPLPPTASRTTWKDRAWLWGTIALVYGLAALSIVAPALTLVVLVAAAAAGALVWGMSRLLDRPAAARGAESPRASHAPSSHVARRDA